MPPRGITRRSRSPSTRMTLQDETEATERRPLLDRVAVSNFGNEPPRLCTERQSKVGPRPEKSDLLGSNSDCLPFRRPGEGGSLVWPSGRTIGTAAAEAVIFHGVPVIFPCRPRGQSGPEPEHRAAQADVNSDPMGRSLPPDHSGQLRVEYSLWFSTHWRLRGPLRLTLRPHQPIVTP